jgi:hypothetical protein
MDEHLREYSTYFNQLAALIIDRVWRSSHPEASDFLDLRLLEEVADLCASFSLRCL